MHIVLFNVLLAATCAYAWWAGGQPEKIIAGLLLIGCAATFALPFDPSSSFRRVELATLTIDLIAMLGFTLVAVMANRFWPLWFTAIHLLTIAVHGAKGYDPGLVPAIYAAATTKLAYPLLVILACGAMRHRDRKRRVPNVADWSSKNRSRRSQTSNVELQGSA